MWGRTALALWILTILSLVGIGYALGTSRHDLGWFVLLSVALVVLAMISTTITLLRE